VRLPIGAALLAAGSARADFDPSIISEVAERAMPAVVNVTIRKADRAVELEGAFRDMLGPRQLRPNEPVGSGVVITADGYIVTNSHVIAGAEEIEVTFADNRTLIATLIGADEPSDVALLRVDAENLPFLALGDSSKLRLGQIVLVVGNPFGVGQTVTMGIVSAQGRGNVGLVEYEDFIQTDAAINPGNSGGALVDLEGRLVGINTGIVSKTRGAAGVGFSVPSAMVGPIRDQILAHGRVRRGWLNVVVQDLTPDFAKALSLGVTGGALIADVKQGPATGRLEPFDVVLAAGDKPMKNAAQLKNAIALMEPGSTSSFSIMRNGKRRTVDVELGEREAETPRPKPQKAEPILEGLEVGPIDAAARGRLRIPERVEGAVVLVVRRGSAADRAQIEEGDVVASVVRKPVRTMKDLSDLVPQSAKTALLRIYKTKHDVFTFVELRR
jgi:serine protease Do